MSASVEVGDVFNLQTEVGRKAAENAIAETEKFSRSIAAPGTLALPELLDKRRVEHGVPDGAFRAQPIFDAVFVYQISQIEGDTFGQGSLIKMADVTKAKERQEAPRGVLVAAGLKALDELTSHGVHLGHVVTFIKLAPFRQRIDIINGKHEHVIVLRSGDIIASEDLATALRNGDVTVGERDGQHVLVDEAGTHTKPMTPWIAEDS